MIAPDGDTVVSGGRDNTREVLERLDWRVAQDAARTAGAGARASQRRTDSSSCSRTPRVSSTSVASRTVRRSRRSRVRRATASPISRSRTTATLLATAENGYGDNVKLVRRCERRPRTHAHRHTDGFAQAVAFSNDGTMLALGSSYTHRDHLLARQRRQRSSPATTRRRAGASIRRCRSRSHRTARSFGYGPQRRDRIRRQRARSAASDSRGAQGDLRDRCGRCRRRRSRGSTPRRCDPVERRDGERRVDEHARDRLQVAAAGCPRCCRCRSHRRG